MKFVTFTEHLLLTVMMEKGIYKWTWQQ